MSNFWPIARRFFLMAIMIYVGLGVVLVLNERGFVYHPNFSTQRDFGDCPGLEAVNYNGSRFYYKSVSDRVVVVYHGNAGNACDRSFLGELFEKLGYSYLLVEYPGFGNDPENGPSKDRILRNTEIIDSFVLENNYQTKVVVGESLGVGVAAYHASIFDVDQLIFISPHYQLSDLAGWIGRIYPVNLMMRENFTPGVWMQQVTTPTLLIYATNDEIVPRQSMERLYNIINAPKKLVEIEGANHNTIYDYQEFFISIEEFLEFENSKTR